MEVTIDMSVVKEEPVDDQDGCDDTSDIAVPGDAGLIVKSEGSNNTALNLKIKKEPLYYDVPLEKASCDVDVTSVNAADKLKTEKEDIVSSSVSADTAAEGELTSQQYVYIINSDTKLQINPIVRIDPILISVCDHCGENFHSKQQYHKHVVSMTCMFTESDDKVNCRACHYVCRSLQDLSSHVRLHHQKNNHECYVCQKRFKFPAYLRIHFRSHTDEKPFKCDVCEMRFAENIGLTRHRRKHTGEKPYKCDVCEKRFSVSSSLTVHKRSHTDEKPYQCNICDKRFTYGSSLIGHKKSHTSEKPHKCHVCNKCFTFRRHLTRHHRTHTGEKSYKCDVCDKYFSYGSSLLRHRKSHTATTVACSTQVDDK